MLEKAPALGRGKTGVITVRGRFSLTIRGRWLPTMPQLGARLPALPCGSVSSPISASHHDQRTIVEGSPDLIRIKPDQEAFFRIRNTRHRLLPDTLSRGQKSWSFGKLRTVAPDYAMLDIMGGVTNQKPWQKSGDQPPAPEN